MSDQSKYRAIVVDDNADVCRLAKRALEAEGVSCDTAEDGRAAMDKLATEHYDIVVSDLRMPRLHGHKLMVELAELGLDIPFVAMTGVTDPRVVKDLYARGAADVITKPFSYAILAVRVMHILEQRRASGGSEASGGSRDRVAHDLETTSRLLQEQLSGVTRSFESTINELNRQRESLESGYLGSVRILANLIEQVGQSKRSHAVRVENACAEIAAAIDYPKEDLLYLKIAALLHEIGAFGMPDGIRLKAPWALDAEERQYFERYPEIGANFLAELEDGHQIVELVESHAECYDGSGFPAKKSGADLSLGARILQIADGCDTYLMHDASGNEHESLRRHLMQEKGRKYDPDLVPAALEYFAKQLYSDDLSFVLPVSEIRVGLLLAENIYDKQGRFLAREGVELTPSLVQRIKHLLKNQELRVVEPAAQ